MVRRSIILLLLCIQPLAAAPPPGHPMPDSAADALNLPRDDGYLPYLGDVLIAVDSNNYTFIKVETGPESSRWLAAPRLLIPKGSRIRYGDGMVMKDFYSRKLKHLFAEITFVRRVQVLAP